MTLIGTLERVLSWMSRHSTASLTFMGTLVTALGAAYGPAWVEEVRERVEKQKARSELVAKVVEATANLDPADPKSVLRFGVVADLVQDNKGVFDLRIDQAKERLKHLSQDMQRGSLGVLERSIKRKDEEVRLLTESSRALRSQAALLNIEVQASATANAGDATGADTGHAASADPERAEARKALRATLERLAEQQEALIRGLQLERENDQQARSDFVKSIEEETRKRQDTEKFITSLVDLKQSLSGQVESQRTLEGQLEATRRGLAEMQKNIGDRLTQDASVVAAEREELKRQRTELGVRLQQVEEQRASLERARESARDLSCQKSNLDWLIARLAAQGIVAAETPLDSGGLTIVVPYQDFAVKQQSQLGIVVDALNQFGSASRQIQVQGYAYDKKGKRKNEASMAKALQALNHMTTRSQAVRDPLRAQSLSVASDAYPSNPASMLGSRVEIVVGPAPPAQLAAAGAP